MIKTAVSNSRHASVHSNHIQVGASVRLVSSVRPFYLNLHRACILLNYGFLYTKHGPDKTSTTKRYLCPLIIFIKIRQLNDQERSILQKEHFNDTAYGIWQLSKNKKNHVYPILLHYIAYTDFVSILKLCIKIKMLTDMHFKS